MQGTPLPRRPAAPASQLHRHPSEPLPRVDKTSGHPKEGQNQAMAVGRRVPPETSGNVLSWILPRSPRSFGASPRSSGAAGGKASTNIASVTAVSFR